MKNKIKNFILYLDVRDKEDIMTLREVLKHILALLLMFIGSIILLYCRNVALGTPKELPSAIIGTMLSLLGAYYLYILRYRWEHYGKC